MSAAASAVDSASRFLRFFKVGDTSCDGRSTKAWRLSAEALGIRRIRMRPIPSPSSSAATAIKPFFSVGRPRTPSSTLWFANIPSGKNH